MGCRRPDSGKVPKCTRTDTDTTADPLNPCNCFQALLCPEHTWRGAPHPFRDRVLFPSDLFASALTRSRCVQGHICILNICSPRAIHPPFVRPDPPTHPPTRWPVVVGANVGQTIPSGAGMVQVQCPNTNALGHQVRSTLRKTPHDVNGQIQSVGNEKQIID